MPTYVILNDDYLTDGYVDSSYVGTDGDLYVASGYIQDTIEGTATVSAQASITAVATLAEFGTTTITSSATVSATATRIQPASATLTAQVSQTALGVATKTASTTATAQATVNSSGGTTKSATANLSDAFNATLIANGILRSTHLITSSVTISAVGNLNPALGSATLQAGSNDDQTWDGDIEWDYPPGVIWGPALYAKAAKIVGGDLTYSLDSTATMTVDGDRTASATLTTDNFASISINATVLSSGSTTLDSVSTQTTNGDLVSGIIDFRMDASSSLSAKGIFQVGGSASITANTTTTTNAIKTARGITTQNSQATLSGTPKRFRSSTSTLNTLFTQSADADRIARTGVSMSSVATQDTTPRYYFGPYQMSMDSAFTFFCNGGRLRNGTATFNALYSTLSALTLYTIDPFRIYTVPGEGRSLIIEQETRISAVKSEERVNTIEAETRAYEIKSETRKLEIQNLALVDVFGPLDRREG